FAWGSGRSTGSPTAAVRGPSWPRTCSASLSRPGTQPPGNGATSGNRMRPRAPVARCCRLACASPSPCSTSRERSGPGRRRPAFLSPRRWTSEMRSAPVQHRGIALILVLTTIAILAAIGVDFSYSSRVSLKLAENLRDETRAEYLARSGVSLARLLLHFQKQVDQLGGQLTQGLTQMMGAGKPPAKPAIGQV